MISSISGMGGGFTPPSPTQIREKMFNTIDKSGDGSIDKDEISTLLANSSSSTGSSSSIDDIMKMLDLDQDGNISQAEFDDVMEQMDPRKNRATGLENNDQSSTIKTLLDALDSSNSAASDIKQKLFSEVDTDGNGTISKEEFEQMHANAPAGGPPPPPPSEQLDSTSYDLSSYDTESNSDSDGLSVTIQALLDMAKHSYLSASSGASSNNLESLLLNSSWSA
jgi:Ca2+-binding EF-hand superfamily protein